MIILGIDPGIATTGYGIVSKKHKNDLFFVDYGVITTSPKKTAGERLEQIYSEVAAIIKKHKPDILAIENVYFFKNLKTIIPVSQAKGVVILAAAKKNLPICEFTPPQVKTTITGYGKAEKKQMQHMIRHILKLREIPKPDDAADALGVAICGALSKQ